MLISGDPSICFESLESECFLLTENQLLTNLALGHAYLQHCNTVCWLVVMRTCCSMLEGQSSVNSAISSLGPFKGIQFKIS